AKPAAPAAVRNVFRLVAIHNLPGLVLLFWYDAQSMAQTLQCGQPKLRLAFGGFTRPRPCPVLRDPQRYGGHVTRCSCVCLARLDGDGDRRETRLGFQASLSNLAQSRIEDGRSACRNAATSLTRIAATF